MSILSNCIARHIASGADTIPTTTLLPSGAVLSVSVMPQHSDRLTLTDDGMGASDVLTFGLDSLSSADARRGRLIAEQHGISFADFTFFVRDISMGQVVAALIHLAEAVRHWSGTDVIGAVEERIRGTLPDVKLDRDCALFGASGKRHKFDLVAHFNPERLAVFQWVSPHGGSLASAHLKLGDLRESHPEWPREAVTESISAWDSADLVLLSNVATLVRDLTSEWSDIRALAA